MGFRGQPRNTTAYFETFRNCRAVSPINLAGQPPGQRTNERTNDINPARETNPITLLSFGCLHHQMVTTISPMLLEKREQEETALEEILGKQASAPSWWPATQGAMNEEHFARIRRAEKKILQEERRGVARPSRSSPEEAEVVSPRN